MTIKRHIPNFLTLMNLFCGSLAAIYAVHNCFVAAALFVFLGIFFDFFDGFFARVLKVQSELGLQLDSLADMVTSGLVPGIVLFKLISMSSGVANIEPESFNDWTSVSHWYGFKFPLIALTGILVTLGAGYRLAKFNIDDEQKDSFVGLPTPANAILILSLPLIMEFQNSDKINAIILDTRFLIVLSLLSAYIMNAKVKLFALKFKTWNFKDNSTRYIFLILCIVLLVLLHFAAIPLIILLYVLMSLITKKS
ncbi:CDP-alcohol phosphatidyltransferase family protein [Mangrovimonas aestuarii]|uniref:CDP-alcohol phosphatidyltransferase family protein n=1 Tax=Mangrovimonas aestuarii TaxID=3018443 RepID=UPI0023784CDD|nr:CDP-alcohol phosphatidyltransferase family protein [Mangrovimonas aestuarii]